MNVGEGPQDSSSGTEADRVRPATGAAGHALARVASKLGAIQGDPTGTLTFARYLWQAKLAVMHWLNLLSDDDRAGILCDRVEDVVVIGTNDLKFAQLKTRDRGSWTAERVCGKGHGIDALVRSYKLAKQNGILPICRFELWLEGPSSDKKATVTFFTDPSTASPDLRSKIRAYGLTPLEVKDFLSKLAVVVNCPARSTVDAVVLRAIGAIWPSLSAAEAMALYESLLDVATKAQAAETQSLDTQTHLSERLSGTPRDPSCALHIPELATQLLSKQMLLGLVPPLPGDTDEQILQRASESGVTALEMKLRRAGASTRTVERAKALRAEADIRRHLQLESGATGDEGLERLAEFVLTVAEATADSVRMQGPAALAVSRPADAIAATLLANPQTLANLDSEGIFASGHQVFGYLCHLSDKCLFGWRSA